MLLWLYFWILKRAFETLNRKKLITKLENYGVTQNALSFFKNYLENRSQVTKFNNATSSNVSSEYGVPQGSTLGPLLFLLYINDIAKVVRACSIHLFADDTLLYFHSKDLDSLIHTVNLELDNVHEWFNQNLLKLNVQKTKFMLIGGDK